jgi:hypothetical protein
MTRLSNRQWPMLRMLYDNGPQVHMTITDAQQFDQRPFRSMLIQGWAAYRPGRGFHITRKGIEAMHEFENTSIERKNPTLPLTAYFDPTAYGLKVVKKSTARETQSKKAPPVREDRRGAA